MEGAVVKTGENQGGALNSHQCEELSNEAASQTGKVSGGRNCGPSGQGYANTVVQGRSERKRRPNKGSNESSSTRTGPASAGSRGTGGWEVFEVATSKGLAHSIVAFSELEHDWRCFNASSQLADKMGFRLKEGRKIGGGSRISPASYWLLIHKGSEGGTYRRS